MSARTGSRRIGPRVVGALTAAGLAVAGAASLSASAQTPVSPNAIQPETTIILNGHGEVDHEPDIAHITVGVSVDAETASAAMSQQAAKMTGVFNAVKASGVAERDMQTSNLSLNPNYSYPDKLPPKLIGYKASNQLTIRVRDLKNLGKTLDAVVKGGGNTINGVSFDVEKPEPLLNEARVLDRQHGELVRHQAEAMQGQVQSYLNRARIAAQRESVLARTDAEPALERLVRVMRRLNVDKEFELSVTQPHLAVAMEQQDLEETVGNLLENAARFAVHKVKVSASEAAEDVKGAETSGRRHWVELIVEDDGPGLEPDQIKEALKRGKRLDESKPGTGLGLSIVTEIANEYQGRLELSRGAAGGLKAKLILPGLTKDVA